MDQQQPAKMKDLSTYNTEEKEAVEVAKLIRSCLFAINNLFATNDLFATNTKKNCTMSAEADPSWPATSKKGFHTHPLPFLHKSVSLEAYIKHLQRNHCDVTNPAYSIENLTQYPGVTWTPGVTQPPGVTWTPEVTQPPGVTWTPEVT